MLLAAAAVVALRVALLAQSPGVAVAGDALHLKAPEFHFIVGDALSRLKNGRSVRFDLDLFVLAEAHGAPVTQGRASFNLSYDLWEERFAVTRIGSPARSTSHLTQSGAEAWCLEQLTVPVSALGRLGRDTPFWLRVAARVVDRQQGQPGAKSDEGFTVWSLIDLFSRRRRTEDSGASLETGPFRLMD